MITIIDYGVGNLGSIQNMLRKIGAPCRISADLSEIETSEKIILPGVGAFDFAMEKLNTTMIPVIIKQRASAGVPILGICLCAQLLTHRSEEGILPGLALLDAHCKKFSFPITSSLKVPHMGWSEVVENVKNSIIDFNGFEEQPRFYFAHSYHIVSDERNIVGTSHYGYNFASVLANGNVVAAQFHPEKSHYFGMRFLENFNRWNP